EPDHATQHQGNARLLDSRDRRRDRPRQRHPAGRLGSQSPLPCDRYRRLAARAKGAAVDGLAQRRRAREAADRGQYPQEPKRAVAPDRSDRRHPAGVRDPASRSPRVPVLLAALSGHAMGLWAIKYADVDDKWWVDVVLQEAPPAVSREQVGGRVVTVRFESVTGPVLARKASIPPAAPRHWPSDTPVILTRGEIGPDSSLSAS